MSWAFYANKAGEDFHSELLDKLAQDGGLVFTNNLCAEEVKPSTMHSADMWYYTGGILADGFLAGRFLYECPTPSRKAVFCPTMDWRTNKYTYRDIRKVYSELLVICTAEIAPIYRQVWNRDCMIANDLTEAWELLHERS